MSPSKREAEDGTLKLPGHIGVGLLGDKSMGFWTDPESFVRSNTEEYGPIWKSRVLTKPSVFVCGHKLVTELLTGPERDRFSLPRAYNSFMGELYGDNVMMASGDDKVLDIEALLLLRVNRVVC